MKSWSVDEMLAEAPCPAYSRDRLVELWAGQERLTLLEICELDIPDIDKVWCGCLAPPPGWVDGIVERAVERHARHCGISSVEEWAEKWLSGADRTKDASAAARAATAAEWEAAAAAEWEAAAAAWAARAAAEWAEAAAAWAARAAAEWAEAAAVAWAARADADAAWHRAAMDARASERNNQVDDLVKILKGDEK